MAEHVIEYDCECGSCGATGLYRGFAEGDGAAVVCHSCGGTGKAHGRVVYRDFEGRKARKGVRRVHQVNVGWALGDGPEHGGLSYEAWLAGAPFSPGTEDRAHVCPAWWWQSADSDRKPRWKEWKECACAAFRDCAHFPRKADCWARFDREEAGKKHPSGVVIGKMQRERVR